MTPWIANLKVLGMVSALVIGLGFPAFADDAPYSLSIFRPVLDDSKLQAPDSSTAVPQGEFEGFSDWFFRLDSTGKYMTFEMDGENQRSELRQMIEWRTDAPTWQKIIGDVRVFYPSTSTLNQFTFMQVHDSGTNPNKPLIRLTWQRSRDGVADHLWSVVRTSATDDTFLWTNLGPRPSGFFKAEIKIKDSLMRVRINEVTKLELDVYYWDHLNSYFKAGVYLQDPGSAKVQFKTLKYYYE